MATALFATIPFIPNRRFPQFLPFSNNLAVSCHASNNQPGRKARASRVAMGDEELCRELREFTISRGLSDDCVPSMKELSDYGRKDLANIVRRRGYKAVKALLQNVPNSSTHQNSANAERNDNADRAADLQSTSISSDNSFVGEKPQPYPNGAKFHAQVSENMGSYIEPLQFELATFTPSGQLDMKEDHSCDADISWKARQLDDQKEIDCLKNLLNEKEIELSQLKRQIEDEKLALYDLQVKTEAEISKIQRAIVEKDLELQAAEESLSGLKEVHIDYIADGQIVELTGSFNGWQHNLKMDLHPSVVHQDPPGVRKQVLWSTVLWLYPGVYEIKFIVDGNWKVDSAREITTSGFVTNNVLRVDR